MSNQKNVVYTSEAGEDYTYNDVVTIAEEALDEFKVERPDDFDKVIDARGVLNLRERLADMFLDTAEWQAMETIADEFGQEPEIYFPEIDEG